ncbi:TPA: PqqD family peptide modification chaperone [Candidatus Poribacteria bacterium]|nr:PqqD family peptide modification chaperone [Candidatus Poribacteria bacterium]
MLSRIRLKKLCPHSRKWWKIIPTTNLQIWLRCIFNLTEEADGALLVDPKTEKTTVLNLVGSVLLKICDGKLSREKMVEVLREKYPEKPVRAIEADIARFLVQLSNVIEPDNIPDGASKNILAYVCAPPRSVGFMITNACNLRCKHCSSSKAFRR